MTIMRMYGAYRLNCDVCGREAEDELESFNDALDYKEHNGWKSQKRGWEWWDVCPECRGVEK